MNKYDKENATLQNAQANSASSAQTTVQESRNRYNALLAQALERIKARKTDETTQQPEEVTPAEPTATTQQPEVTTQEQPEPVATPEEVTTSTPVQEPEEVTTEDDNAPATDDAILLRNLIDQYGNVGADYLDTLDYSKATEQAPRKEMFIRAEVTKKEYTTDKTDLAGNPQTFGLSRCHNRNGKRAIFTVYKDGQAIELRWYGKNNNTYKAYIRYNGGILRYEVEGGKVTRAERETIWDNKISVEFDDTNRPVTPRDLPAPTPSKPTSKETTKEEPATTVQEQPTSKTAPTPEATTAPEEVQPVTTSKPEDGPAPYWLLLDNELKAQQQEQETAPATPENVKQEEPMHAPQMLKKMIEEHYKRIKEGTATKSIYNANALQAEVLTPKRAKELLGDDSSDYKTYILVAGKHLVETNRPTLKNTLYIDDESKEYKEYQRGNISKIELYRDDMMSMYGSESGIKAVEDNPATLTVDGTKDKVLSFNLYRRADYGYRRANPDEVEIYKAAMRANHEAFIKRLDSYIKRYGKKIYVHSYWANR